MILVADAHVSETNGTLPEFRRMLTALEATEHDVVFLGDILDLWIAIPRYEESCHRELRAWCERQKAHRTVGFVEGNHEFFLHRRWGDSFSWCVPAEHWDGPGTVFAHGDLVNAHGYGHLWFRHVTRSWLARALLTVLPGGPRLTHSIKNCMGARRRARRHQWPEAEIRDAALQWEGRGAKRVFLGHFHREYRFSTPGGAELVIVPAWQESGHIARWDEKTDTVGTGAWRDLLGP